MKKPSLKIVLSIFVAFVLVQSLIFKFSNSYETMHIFNTLGEWSGFAWFGVYGGYMVGTAELIATVLLFSRFHNVGALMTVGIITGAIFFHLFTPLGIVMPEFDGAGNIVGKDGGTLFIMACLVWLSGMTLLIKGLKSEDPFIAGFGRKGK
ncbi:hypothetical protein [Alteromonas sp. C1M14]|uniref:hypothetical protein n=1 Tax=Alteromonas sp. C1M14 TaxID=2841567 RepID=UPI001C0A02A7|nr:hypothetical protein [Alteromonas sp. C1M14]MBU2976843.1 hypothetical protein [Alteromonas sp. C1M14]